MHPPLAEMRIRNPYTDRGHHAGKKNLLSRSLAGTRGANVRGIGSNHQGWDLYADENTPIFAIAGGTIATVVDREPFTTGHGRYLTLAFQFADPDDREMKTFYALYSHLKAIHVQVGAVVAEGYPLGLTGTSGNARGGPPHLHFGILRSAHPQKGLEGNIDPGHVLGFHTLNFDTLFPNWNRA